MSISSDFYMFLVYHSNMKKIVVLIFFIAVQSILPAQEISTITSASITFNFIEKDVEGSFGGFTSTSTIDWEAIENSNISGSVATETIKTGNFIRDWSLKGDKYFNSDKYSKITFKSTKIVREKGQIIVDGTLTLKGISKPIQIQFKKEKNQFIGTTTLFSSDYDITILKKGRDSNKVIVNFALELD